MNNTTDRDFEMVVGDRTVKARVPLHMSDRFRIHDALLEIPDGEGLALCCAVVGLCWADDSLNVPTLRSQGYDLVEYGECVYDALFSLGLGDQVVPAAFAARQKVVDSIPTPSEVEEAADPIVAQEGGSTASM